MAEDRKCVECGSGFNPKQYKQVLCSDECRAKHKKKYAKKLQASGYFTKWQRDNKDAINAARVNSYGAKIGRVDGKLPAKSCPECGTSFVPKNRNKRFCTHKCNVKYMQEHPEEKSTYKKRKKSG